MPTTWVVRTEIRAQLAPIRIVGELVLQGPTVARGYLHDQARTSANFAQGAPWLVTVGNPWHQRVYLTGDLVRYTSDGSLEHLGRRDNQVRIRGHRIELEEIEHHINAYLCGTSETQAEKVLNTVVEVFSSSHRPEQKALAAFLPAVGEDAWLARQDDNTPFLRSSRASRTRTTSLHSFLLRILPSYTVPSLYIPLKLMPTSSAGKANRQLLWNLVASLPNAESATYYPCLEAGTKSIPTTATQQQVAELWADTIGIDVGNIEANDNSLQLGGDLILAMRFAIAARNRGFSVTIAEVLKFPLLKDIAAVIERHTKDQKETSSHTAYSPYDSLLELNVDYFLHDVLAPRLSVSVSDIEDVAPATDYQTENLAWSSLKQRAGTNYITFDFSHHLDPSRLQSACEQLVSYHSILRAVYLVNQRRTYQVVLRQLPYDLVFCHHTKDVLTATSVIMRADLAEPLDIKQALIKSWLLQTKSDGGVQRLVMRASHL